MHDMHRKEIRHSQKEGRDQKEMMNLSLFKLTFEAACSVPYLASWLSQSCVREMLEWSN